MLSCGVLEDTIKQAKSRQYASWSFIDDPVDKRRVLIEYEKLSKSYKEKVHNRYGNPYNYVAKQPIKERVQWDARAEAFYLAYRFDKTKSLPLEHVDKYTKAASWLNMLREITKDKRTLKKVLNLSMDQFYTQTMELIKIEEVDLPRSYRKLLEKCKKYDSDGYSSLIDWRFGNTLAAKISDEISESVLLEMIQHENQYDDVFICKQYNIWASKNGYKTIEPATVGVHRKKNAHLIIMNREGNAALTEKYIKQVKGFRPSNPLYLVESDDNHLDLYFIDPDDNSASKYFHKYKAIVIIDSFNDYVLGYAYSETLNTSLVRAAYINAMYHIKECTGGWYLPFEIKTDRWAQKELRPFYESIGNYVPAALGNKHRGYIEQFFSKPLWKQCLKAGANNYSGNNITAKNRGINQEALNSNKKNWPVLGNESTLQVEQFFHRLRYMPDHNGRSKHAQWMEAWNQLSENKKRPCTEEQFLLKFGIEHNHNGEGIRITNKGINPKISGNQYSYDLEQYHMEYIGKSVSVIYDPFDMSRVLLTDYKKIRIIAREARLQPRAIQDGYMDSRHFLNSILQEKVDQVSSIAAASDRRKKVLNENHIDAEALLQAGVIIKEIKQVAEQKALNSMIDNSLSDKSEEYNIYNFI